MPHRPYPGSTLPYPTEHGSHRSNPQAAAHSGSRSFSEGKDSIQDFSTLPLIPKSPRDAALPFPSIPKRSAMGAQWVRRYGFWDLSRFGFQHYTSSKLTPYFSVDFSEVRFAFARGNEEQSEFRLKFIITAHRLIPEVAEPAEPEKQTVRLLLDNLTDHYGCRSKEEDENAGTN